jgi:hypothetical protein
MVFLEIVVVEFVELVVTGLFRRDRGSAHGVSPRWAAARRPPGLPRLARDQNTARKIHRRRGLSSIFVMPGKGIRTGLARGRRG